MNRLQNIQSNYFYLLTLNPIQSIDSSSVIQSMVYYHPVFTKDSIATQPLLKQLNGNSHLFFCGSYFGYGFHEDAISSAMDVISF